MCKLNAQMIMLLQVVGIFTIGCLVGAQAVLFSNKTVETAIASVTMLVTTPLGSGF